ncbi:hypothetical protein [Leptolyngbya sp. FACHB-711]|nr:hypothetical protein [Leptolyngbya sp. FACHB-711]
MARFGLNPTAGEERVVDCSDLTSEAEAGDTRRERRRDGRRRCDSWGR